MSDLISRQDAIDALERKKDKNAKGDIGGFYNKIIQNDIDTLMQMPSAQQETEKRTAETAQNVPNGDLISRKMAIDLIEDIETKRLMGEIGLMYAPAIKGIKALPSVQPEHRWIPVSERLPEETRKSYWICTDAGYQCECRWTNINHLFTDLTMKWHWHIMDVPQYDSVVAWMPLPEPYGGEQE